MQIVEIIDEDIGLPTWFWLKIIDSSLSRMEEELEKVYKFYPKIGELPIPGTLVVCKNEKKFCRAKVVIYFSKLISLSHFLNFFL